VIYFGFSFNINLVYNVYAYVKLNVDIFSSYLMRSSRSKKVWLPLVCKSIFVEGIGEERENFGKRVSLPSSIYRLRN
jgi:hypothetical protein